MLEIVGTSTQELAYDPETALLYFPVRSVAPGVHVVNTTTDAVLTPSAVATGPAVDVLVVRETDATTSPPLSAPGSALRVGLARPNPFRKAAWIPVSTERDASATLTVFDAAGRRVHIRQVELAAGEHRVAWDGRDGTGAPAAAGTYFLRLATGGGAASCCCADHFAARIPAPRCLPPCAIPEAPGVLRVDPPILTSTLG